MAKKGATGDFFFAFLQKKIISPKMDNISYQKKKKIAAARLASILATRWTGNRLFFMDNLTFIKSAIGNLPTTYTMFCILLVSFVLTYKCYCIGHRAEDPRRGVIGLRAGRAELSVEL